MNDELVLMTSTLHKRVGHIDFSADDNIDLYINVMKPPFRLEEISLFIIIFFASLVAKSDYLAVK